MRVLESCAAPVVAERSSGFRDDDRWSSTGDPRSGVIPDVTRDPHPHIDSEISAADTPDGLGLVSVPGEVLNHPVPQMLSAPFWRLSDRPPAGRLTVFR